MNLAKYIDHTILAPEATQSQVDQIIKEAKEYDFASVVVNPYWVSYVADKLKGTDVNTVTVIGFPLGANTTATKVFEAKDALQNGATELDMVINIGELKAGHDDAVLNDIKAVVEAGHAENRHVKVIIETALLTDEEKVRACELSEKAGADFVKTSTGFSTAGAKVADVKLMKQTVGDRLGVKASGGIHTKAEAEAMIEAGATRLGASSGVKIMNS
ncbi:deoxyribose-phosphate aldolase [Pediococcus acidilactici]|jgi:deoxyribose-phosphate aldolase|uniref:deoxyribose-phosphate aldolase n=1 Tax=Pediococcus acidilactici TaxID=1254 RepID=UPI0003270BE8|nr:deoxyribose-phosphate aldolase [Pediococcus acidilactici]EOA08315.1 deoxyribose-phosphate aldolase, deoC [Pediococcus acidilactici D3]KAF0424665.1 deoxyribose-phosphate aldolase [Pediococcus acidilactici]KAF0492822.1 deoxyribose-phosphate aldolase [Pediococcus acidilactici]KAF0515894.1 deoxyribose-phosphate aldolase [Pediococcus acidilactici]MBS9399443.1 deoxyribose-phosphate aldolase [Pediococcus acidilactici]